MSSYAIVKASGRQLWIEENRFYDLNKLPLQPGDTFTLNQVLLVKQNNQLELGKPFLKDKKIRTYVTHGAPAIPVKTLYLNSVKLRLVMGVYSFVFGWKLSLFTKTKQFWSVPFVSDAKRKKYLDVVRKDVQRDIKKATA